MSRYNIKTNLSIGLVGNYSSIFQTLTDNIGLNTIIIKSINEGIELGLKVFVCFDEKKIKQLSSQFSGKIAIISTHSSISKILNKKTILKKSLFYSPSNNKNRNIYLNHIISSFTDNKDTFVYDDSLKKSKITGPIFIEKKNIIFLSLPFEFLKLTRQEIGFSYRPYFSKILNKYFCEVGSNVDWSQLSKLLKNNLAKIYDNLDMPFIYLSNKINGRYFVFRIDADGFDNSSNNAVLSLLKKNSIKSTWFIDVMSWVKKLDYVKKIISNKHHIGLHCFRHITYKSFFTNLINLKIGKFFLNRYIKHNMPIVSPFGHYFYGFQKSVDFLSFSFSSEFGYDTNNTPSYPNHFNSVLQIPFYPGSIGVYKNSKWSKNEIKKHINFVINNQINNNGICSIYDHPYKGIDLHIDVFEDIFNKIKNSSIKNIHISKYMKYWTSRNLGNIYYIHNKVDLPHNKYFNYNYNFKRRISSNIDMSFQKIHKKDSSLIDFFPIPSKEIINQCNHQNQSIKEINNGVFLWMIRSVYTCLKNFLRK